MIVLLYPTVILCGILTFILFFTQLRGERIRGENSSSQLFVILWFLGTLVLLFFTSSSWLSYLEWAGRGFGLSILPDPHTVFLNNLYALIPAFLISMGLLLCLLLDQRTLAHRVAEGIEAPNY